MPTWLLQAATARRNTSWFRAKGDHMRNRTVWIALMALTSARATGASPRNASKKIVVRWYEAFNHKDAAVLDEILDPGWTDIPSAPDQPAGPAGARQLLVELTAIFPDFTIRMEDVLQDGNKVIVRSEISATQTKAFMGFPASQRKMTIQAVDIHELRDGKIVRTWHTEDWMTGFRHLGVCMPPQKTGEDQ
jgi:steroid delta-isomerase-like uncharacterized protein